METLDREGVKFLLILDLFSWYLHDTAPPNFQLSASENPTLQQHIKGDDG